MTPRQRAGLETGRPSVFEKGCFRGAVRPYVIVQKTEALPTGGASVFCILLEPEELIVYEAD